MMLFHTDGKPLKTHLRTLSVLVFHLLLTHYCRGQSQLIGSPQPAVANLGGDIIFPCYLEPALNVADLTLEWTRPDLNPRFVHVLRSGNELKGMKHTIFKGRTSMFTDELKNGNMSMKLSNVQLSDQGKYRCFIPELDRQAFVKLVCVSAAAHPPVVTLSGLDGQSGGVVLQCESAGWYPKPEVLWLDAEGKLLSAGPPETVRGPDDLYTVSSRVTVEKRPSNSFTCRVQHHNTTRTTQTQTHFQVPDDFFKLQSRSSSINIGLAVSLAVCILLMLAVSFFSLWREHIFKTKRKHTDEVDKGEKKNRSKTKDQFLNEGERGQLMKPDAVQMEALKGNVGKKSKPKNQSEQQLLEEQRRREEAEKEVQTLKEQLQNKKKEVESKDSELKGLHAEKQRNEKELQSLKGDLENKNRELERSLAAEAKSPSSSSFKWPLVSRQNFEEKQKRKEGAEKEVHVLNEKLQKETREQADQKVAELGRVQKELKETQSHLEIQRKENSQLKREFEKKLQEEKRRREETEREVKDLKKEPQAGRFGGSDNSRSVEPLRTPPSPQTSDSGFNIEIDQQRKFIRLRNTSTEGKQMGQWELHLQVNNNKTITYKFDRSFDLRAGGFVTMWVKGHGHNYSNTDLVWMDLNSWSSGDSLEFTLYNHMGICNMNAVWQNPK